jgi:hypothetical protein
MLDTWGAKDNYRLISDRFASYRFDLRRPEKGVEAACAGMHSAVFSLPALNSSATELADHFVRYEKMFARFLQRENSALEISMLLQTGNSWLESDLRHRVSALELTLSVQTPLLDADPIDQVGLTASSTSPTRCEFFRTINSQNPLLEAESPDNGLIVSNSEVALLLMIHSSDFSGMEFRQSESSIELLARLRSQNMEKGVIRRYRLLFAVMPHDQVEVLKSVANAFENADLPLST